MVSQNALSTKFIELCIPLLFILYISSTEQSLCYNPTLSSGLKYLHGAAVEGLESQWLSGFWWGWNSLPGNPEKSTSYKDTKNENDT
jgi:hypothetical protein